MVTVDDFKTYAQIDLDFKDDDDLIASLLVASVNVCEDYCGVKFEPKEYTEYLSSLDDSLKHAPVIDVISADLDDPTLIVKARPYNGIKVVYTAGFEALPQNIKVAIMMLAKSYYDNRESFTIADNFNAVSDLPINIRSLLRPHSIKGGNWLY